jgi:hypothetical protein
MQQEPGPRTGRSSRRALVRLGLVMAICFFFATTMPRGLIMATFSSLLTLAAMGTVIFALLLREPVWAGYVTRWDQASVLLALSLIAGWTVDPDAAAEALSQIETARAASAS